MKNRADKTAVKPWNQFVDILRDQSIKEGVACWYVVRTKHYLCGFSGSAI